MNASTKNKLLYAVIITLIVVNLALMAFLYINRPDRHPEFTHDRREKSMAKGMSHMLNLTDDQKRQFEVQMSEHMSRMRVFSEEMQSTKARLGNLLDNPEQPEVTFLLDSLGELHWAQEEEIFRHSAALYEICDSEQKRKLKTLFQQSFQRRRPRHD